MKVHFIAAKQNIQTNIPYYRQVIDAITKHDDNLAQDWVESAHKLSLTGEEAGSALDWVAIYRENMEILAGADVVIADISETNFAVGYMVAVGLQHKKPTLILFREKTIEDTMASGMDESLVVLKEYNKETIEGIVNKFLDDNRIETKDMRFNFFIDRPIYNYLRWAAYKTGKTKAEILRELVTREIDKANDADSF